MQSNHKNIAMLTNTDSAVRTFQRFFLMGVLLLLLFALVLFISPLLIDLLFAGVIVTAVFPAHRWIMKKVRFRSVAAGISMILIICMILIPFTVFGFMVAEQAGDAYVIVSERIEVIVAENDVSSTSKILQLIPFHDQIAAVMANLPISSDELLQRAGDLVGNISSFLLSKTTNILKQFSLFLLHVLVFLISLFFFLREGDRLVLYVRSLLPMSKLYREELFSKLGNLSYGIIYGIFGAAILQGILVGIGFSVADINNPAFWGSLAALFSPVPYIGVSIVWIPAVIALAIGGKWLAALLLMAWCVLIVSAADNVVKPVLIGSSTKLNPLAVLLVLLGGTLVFGLKGLFFGPFVLSLSLSFLHIYQLEYKEVLERDEKNLLKKEPHKVAKRRMAKRKSA